MAESKTETQAYPLNVMGVIAPIAGWLIPGAGHLLQGRWIRGALLMMCVALMFAFGLGMEGKIYSANSGDVLDILGFVGDLGTGCLYFA
ncbi:MAG TPA: DUF6677 family protein, partial [Candidatus Angelobacter sp.]|nr:DUF6677 family protein [Candidatus Angelobacter sp.]